MDTKEKIILVLVLIGFLFLMIISGNLYAKKSCVKSYSEYKPQYTFWSRCRVEWNGKITPVDIIREIN